MALGKSRVNLVASNTNQLSLAQIKEGFLKKIIGNLKATKDEIHNPAGFAGTDLLSLEPVTPFCFSLSLFHLSPGSLCQLIHLCCLGCFVGKI